MHYDLPFLLTGLLLGRSLRSILLGSRLHHSAAISNYRNLKRDERRYRVHYPPFRHKFEILSFLLTSFLFVWSLKFVSREILCLRRVVLSRTPLNLKWQWSGGCTEPDLTMPLKRYLRYIRFDKTDSCYTIST